MKRTVAATTFAALLMLAPVSSRAAEPQQHDDITITRDGQFDRAHGVRSGRGTPRNPYVISGWEVHNLTIADTTKAVRIEGNMVHGLLTLNWIGRNVTVMHNHVGDLRVNENVPRWGAPTSGMIERNQFGTVSQIRHFDGMFMRNVVGSPGEQFGAIRFFGTGPVVNFDGFNGAHFAYNTVYGPVAAQLHGHHHSSRFGTASHMHTGEMDAADHSRRFHEVWIHGNKIVTQSQFALTYLDTGHEANDRTAASETNPNLNAPHTHWTRVHLVNNVLEGPGGIAVEVFNARDELHKTTGRGLVEIVGNRITLKRDSLGLFQYLTGIAVREARGLTLKIDRNTVSAPVSQQTQQPLRDWEMQGAGISLGDIDGAAVTLSSDRVTNLTYGIEATRMTKSVTWRIDRLSTSGVAEPVAYDSSVANKPQRR